MVSIVELSNWGEVFLNKELIKIMEYADERNVLLFAHNGVNLNDVEEEVLEALVKHRFRGMTCSIDGASQEAYSGYRVRGRFQRVIENIKIINAFKARYHSRFPLMAWQFVAFGHNEHEIGKAKRMAKELDMEFSVKLSWEDLYTESFSPVKDLGLIRKETGLGAGNRHEFRQKYGEEHTRKCCLDLWSSPQINYDGRVLGCSVNYWDDYGNAFKDGLESCLNSDKINYAREMLMGRAESKKGIPCTPCRIYQSMKENRTWLKNRDIWEGHAGSRVLLLFDNSLLGHSSARHMEKWFQTLRRRLRRRDFSEP